MVLLTHVIIALASMVYTTYLVAKPSKPGIKASYALIGLTLATGTYLVVSTGSPILQSCLTGLVYLAMVASGLLTARRRLAKNDL